jgi:hypothetical protein
MEETMRVLTLTELLHLTRTELCALLTEIATGMTDLAEGTPELHNAHANLHKIRWALARGDFSP